MKVDTFTVKIWFTDGSTRTKENLSRVAVWKYLAYFQGHPLFKFAEVEGKDLT